jgi:sterol 3beta-glucosyltransferase
VVVHHGGAGTTACGLVNARPTIIIPFFGDQPFWGRLVAAAGAGAAPIPHRELTTEALVEALQHCFAEKVQVAAREIATNMRREDGVQAAVESFHRNLPIPSMVCDVLPQYAATWKCKKKGNSIKLCDLAASALIAEGKVKSTDLKP